MQDITDALKFADTPPPEAAKNISRSNLVEVTPDAYKESAATYDPEIEALEQPTKAHRAVAELATTSAQHASIVKPDLKKLNRFERFVDFTGSRMNAIPETQREISKLQREKYFNPSKFNEDKQLIINQLNVDLQAEQEIDYELSDGEEFAGEVVGGVTDMLRGFKDNADIIMKTTAIGAGTMALLSAPIPVPGSTILATKVGAVKGLVTGVALAGFNDGFDQMSGMFFNEMENAKDKDGNPLAIDKDTIRYTGTAVGVLGGAISATIGYGLAKGNPFIRNTIPKTIVKKIVANPSFAAKMKVLGYITKSVAEGGIGEGVTEAMTIIAEEYTKSTKNKEDPWENILTEKTLDRVIEAAKIGAGTSGAIATITGVPGYSKEKRNYVVQESLRTKVAEESVTLNDDGSVTLPFEKQVLPPDPVVAPEDATIKKSVEALETQNDFVNASEQVKNTELKKYNPAEMSAFKRKVYGAAGFDKNFYLAVEDLKEWANTAEKLKVAQNLIDSSGALSNPDVDIDIEPHKFSDIVDQFPDVTEIVKTSPDGMKAKAAREYLTSLNEAKAKRAEIMDALGIEGKPTPEQQAVLQEALNKVYEKKKILNREDFLSVEEIYPQTIESVLNPDEVAKYKGAQEDSRRQAAKSMEDDVARNYQGLENDLVKLRTEEVIQSELKGLDKKIELLRKFDKARTSDKATQLRSTHKKKGHSPLAIDPKYLTEDQKAIYLDNETLKRRKMFVQGGLSPNEVASMTGLKSGDDVLKFVAFTPDTKDVLKSRKDKAEIIRKRVKADIEPVKTEAQDQVFTNVTLGHLRGLKVLKDKHWPQMKGSIKRIVRKLPTIEELNVEAKDTVKGIRVKDLEPRKFAIAEKKANDRALNSILDNDPETAFDAKENAARNSELAKESTRAKKLVVKAETYLKKITKDRNFAKVLKEAGKDYEDAYNFIIENYKLDTTSKRGVAEKAAFDKFVENRVQEGKVNFEIPERFNDARESASEMTVEAYLAIADVVRGLENDARKKNKLSRKFREQEMVQTLEAIVEKGIELTQEHPDFDPKNAEVVPEGSIPISEKLKAGFDTSINLLSNIKNIADILDQGKRNGYFTELLVKPVTDARTNKRQKMFDINNRLKELDATFDNKLSKNINIRVFVPEFANFASLGYGEMRKSQLMMLLGYMGDPAGRKRIENFVSVKDKDGNINPITAEDVMKVLDRELDEKDAALTQNLVNIMKSFEEESFELHKRTTGQDAIPVVGVPVTHRGKVLPGGYFPLNYQFTSSEVKAQKKYLADLQDQHAKYLGIKDGKLFGQLRAAEHTEQGRFESRTGSTAPLDLDINQLIGAYEEIVHDLTFRETGIDLLKILGHAEFEHKTKSVIGYRKYNLLRNGVVEVIGKTNEKKTSIFAKEEKFMNAAVSYLGNAHAVAVLGLNLSSIAMQTLSLPNAALRMGDKGATYLAKAAKKIALNLDSLDGLIQVAEQLLPDIKTAADGIDDTLTASTRDAIPGQVPFFKKWEKSSEVLATLQKLSKGTIDYSMSGMKEADRLGRVLVTIASADQLLSGDAEGYSPERLATMSDQEKVDAAKAYVKQINDLALTVSAIEDKKVLQKNFIGEQLTKYANDALSQLNTYIMGGRQIKYNVKKAYKNIQDGDYKSAKGNAREGASVMLRMAIAGAMVKLVADQIRQQPTPIQAAKEIESEEDLKEYIGNTISYFSTGLPEAFIESTPIARDIKFNYFSDFKNATYRDISLPTLQPISTFGRALKAATEGLGFWMQGDDVDFSDKQMKDMMYAGGFLTRVPVNGPLKIKKYMETLEEGQIEEDSMSNTVRDFNEAANIFIERYKDKPEAKQAVEDIKKVQAMLPQSEESIKPAIPDTAKEELKQSLSEGKWNAYNADTGAAGIYQFTEERWNQISEANPELELTENGRVSKDSSQQEKAMDWVIQDSARGLTAYEVPVNEKTLLGAHIFGVDNYALIHTANGNDKLSKVLDAETLSNPVFKNFKTVKSVRDYLTKKTK